MPPLDASTRAHLPDTAFAYVDSTGRRRLPINDVAHVRNALSRFDQTAFESDEAKERARQRLLRAAKKHGIVPLGFFDGQLRKARTPSVSKLPRGTVTFLLTDIEDSTGLLRQLGDAYPGVLRDVRTIMRSSVRRAEGHEVDARADEYFAVFRRADGALIAALEILRALRDRSFARRKIRVRMGMHTGRPSLSEAGYVGIAVHTAARVCWASRGGYLLLSSSARDALKDAGAGDVSFQKIGRHALAGLEEAQTLYVACADDLLGDFPGPRTSKAETATRG